MTFLIVARRSLSLFLRVAFGVPKSFSQTALRLSSVISGKSVFSSRNGLFVQVHPRTTICSGCTVVVNSFEDKTCSGKTQNL